MEKILINGNFLNRNLTGIERFSWETCKRLDGLITEQDHFSILVSANPKVIPEFKNIKVIRSKKIIKNFPFWDLIEFPKFCKKNGAVGLNFSNTAPLGKRCGYAFLHDIYAKAFPNDFSSLKDKLVRAYSLLNYRNIAKNAKILFTVSEFSKKQISEIYKISPKKICVIPNGWDHFVSVEEDEHIFEKFPSLKKGSFYFTLGSLSKRKNLAWICEYAKNHPDENFAVSGKAISGLVPEELKDLKTLKNVTLLGYVSDGEVKSLMKNCKSFVFPSYYEGFGIPPLEALSVGAKIIVSKAASLPEIYKDTAYYILPDNTNIQLDELLKEKTAAPDEILKKYTYDAAAQKLLEILKNS